MKKKSLIIMFVLSSVFFISSISYSDNDDKFIWQYGDELLENARRTHDNYNDFGNILKLQSTKNDERNVLVSIKHIGDVLLWSHDLIEFSEKKNEDWHLNKWFIGRYLYIQAELENNLGFIDRRYGFIKIVSLLHILDKQRDITRSSIKILDGVIELMKKMILEEKMKEMEQKYKSN